MKLTTIGKLCLLSLILAGQVQATGQRKSGPAKAEKSKPSKTPKPKKDGTPRKHKG